VGKLNLYIERRPVCVYASMNAMDDASKFTMKYWRM